ncbi:MAG: hypothetical protein PVSMB7_28710 [Chloroflexota bacterium]
MHLSRLTERIARQPLIASLAQTGSPQRLYGLLHAAMPAFVSALACRADRFVFVVTAHPQSAADIAHELSLWSGPDVQAFPALEPLPYERVPFDRLVLSQRERVIREMGTATTGIVVAPVRALLQPIARRTGVAGGHEGVP